MYFKYTNRSLLPVMQLAKNYKDDVSSGSNSLANQDPGLRDCYDLVSASLSLVLLCACQRALLGFSTSNPFVQTMISTTGC